MKQAVVSIIGLMGLTVLVALNLWLLRALPGGQMRALGLGIWAVLPMLNVVAVCVGVLLSGISSRRACSLPLLAFVLAGGAGAFLLLFAALLAPDLSYRSYWAIADPLRNYLMDSAQKAMAARGMMPAHPPDALMLLFATPLLLIPALVAARLCRGYRLRLVDARREGHVGNP